MSKLDNKYKLHGRQIITNKCLREKAEKMKRIIKQKLFEANFVSLTLDAWSSEANDSYLGTYL